MTAQAEPSELSDSTTGLTQSALVDGLADHQEWALKALIELCGKHVYGRAIQILRDPHLSEEVAQDVLLVLWWNPERFDPAKGDLRSFLMGVTRNKAIDRVRHQEVIRTRDSLQFESAELLTTPSVEQDVTQSLVLRAALTKLPVDKREALYLAYYRGFTYKQVAQVLQVPEGTAKSRIRESLITMRALLTPPATA